MCHGTDRNLHTDICHGCRRYLAENIRIRHRRIFHIYILNQVRCLRHHCGKCICNKSFRYLNRSIGHILRGTALCKCNQNISCRLSTNLPGNLLRPAYLAKSISSHFLKMELKLRQLYLSSLIFCTWQSTLKITYILKL